MLKTWLVLQIFGFAGPFPDLISTMHSAPSTNVIAAGHISNSIPLHKRIRQGCPLSPLLFNLALFHSYLHRLMVGQHELHKALLANDILIFTSDPKINRPHIQEIFTFLGMLKAEDTFF